MNRRTRGPEPRARRGRAARGEPGPRPRLGPLALLLALLLVGAGCARKLPPSGGPPDLVQPTVVSVTPDSGATGVARDVRPVIEFSEGMDPRSSALAVEIAPHVDIRQRRWSGRRLTVVFDDTLRTDHTYTLFIGADARDRHGNGLAAGRAVPFSTADRFPPGVIEGRVRAEGFAAPGTYLWCYPEGRAPDSTARDFDAIGLAGEDGSFRITGLAVPGRYRVWAFADLNRNHSLEPERDLLVEADTTLALSAERPEAGGLSLRVVNPRAQGRVRGTVLDSLGDDRGQLRLIVLSTTDSTRRLLYDVGGAGAFDLKFDPGTYRVRAFRDLDRNKAWKRDEEPASDEVEMRVPPAGDFEVPPFVLVRAAARRDGP